MKLQLRTEFVTMPCAKHFCCTPKLVVRNSGHWGVMTDEVKREVFGEKRSLLLCDVSTGLEYRGFLGEISVFITA